MNNQVGPQVGVSLYSFTNEWLTRQYDLRELLQEVAKRDMGPNVEIIGFQNFKEFHYCVISGASSPACAQRSFFFYY